MYPGKVVALPKEQATFTKARIALMWMKCLSLSQTFQARIYKEPSGCTHIGIKALEVLHDSFNMGTRDMPEMYAHSPWAAPLDFGHAFQANHSCPCYNYKIY